MNGIDIENMIKSLEIVKMYDNEEKINFDKIKNNLIDINSNYNTSNYNKLMNIQVDLINKMNVIKLNHYNNEVIINKNIIKYIDTAKKVENMFDNIEG